MKEINVKRLEVSLVEKKLNNLIGCSETGSAFVTILTLTKPSPKYRMPAGAPMVAVVKKTPDGNLAVFNSLTAKSEIIPSHSFKEPTPVGNTFEFGGHVYQKNPVHDLYTLKK